MTILEAKELIEFCRDKGIKNMAFGQFAVEFYPSAPQPMALDPVSLSKTLVDSMPPDAAMLFASSGEELPDLENLTPKSRESTDMP